VTGEVVIKEIPDQQALTVTRHVSMAQVAEGMGEAFGALMGHAQASGAQFTGPPFCYYPGEVGEEFDIVVCMPVAPGAQAGAGVALETVPGGTCASAMHQGSYSSMEQTYNALQAWMAANGKRPAGPPREVYLNDPSQVAESELLTEIDWPVA
jgi:effector-binding domain-containing protein